MKIEMIKHPTDEDWLFCRQCTLNTIGKRTTKLPTDEWKVKLLRSEHSPIRTLWFAFRMEIPYWVSVHFCRHKFGVEHFVSTQRDDRIENASVPREFKPQGETVTHIMYVNAQELMQMARKRLCNQASPETREVMQMIKDEVLKTNPEFKEFLVPACQYAHECKEFSPCIAKFREREGK